MISFAAAILSYWREALSASRPLPFSPEDREDASPVSLDASPLSVKSALSEKVADTQHESIHQAQEVREELPEPEPEGCDEDSHKSIEVCLERLPGEAWGFAWHRKAFSDQRLIIVAIDGDSPAGRWQQERKHRGLPTLERGDELVCANELAQHSSMQISLVVANKLRLKFLRPEGIAAADLAAGIESKMEIDASKACKEEVLKDTPVPPLLQTDAFAESDMNDLEETGEPNLWSYDGVPRNFWSYQRLPLRSVPGTEQALDPARDPASEEELVQSARLRSHSDSPAAPVRRGGSPSPQAKRRCVQALDVNPPSSPTAPRSPASRQSRQSPQSAVEGFIRGPSTDAEKESQLLSSGSGSEARSDQCPSTDWEYMMDNRAHQCQPLDPAHGSGVMMLALQPLLDTSAPPPLTSEVPGMPASSGLPGAGLMVPMQMNHGFAAPRMVAPAQTAQVLGWAPAWHAGAPPLPEACHPCSTSNCVQSTPVDESAMNPAARTGKKTYRAGQRLTARRLRAAQRAAELSQTLPLGPAPAASPRSEPSSEDLPGDGPEPSALEAHRKPRRRAGVRVRRRREHAIARRREQEEQGDAPQPQPVGAVPPGPLPRQEEDGLDSPAEMDVQSFNLGSSASLHTSMAKPLHSQAGASHPGHPVAAGGQSPMLPPLREPECDVIGREVLINGLVHTPHLNGHWGRVADFDPAQNRYLVHAFVTGSSPLSLRLRRDAFVVPKTSPPSPDEIIEGVWQPSLRM